MVVMESRLGSRGHSPELLEPESALTATSGAGRSLSLRSEWPTSWPWSNCAGTTARSRSPGFAKEQPWMPASEHLVSNPDPV